MTPTAPPIRRSLPITSSPELARLAAALLVAAAIGAGAAVIATRGDASSVAGSQPRAGVAVTDGWAHSSITRLGVATTGVVSGLAATDGWQHSPLTRLGNAYDPNAGVAVTDGWQHSPITRHSAGDARAMLLRQLATQYVSQDPAADARTR